MPNKYIGEVDAPEFGEGYTIRLDMHGQGQLETKFGDFEFAHKVHYGLSVMNSTHLRAFLDVALRKDGEVGKAPNGALENGPLEPIARKCLDAFTLFRYGKDAETWAADNEKEQRKKTAAANPTKGTKA